MYANVTIVRYSQYGGAAGDANTKISKSPGIKKNQFPVKYKIYMKLTYLIS